MPRSSRIDVQEGVPELAGADFAARYFFADDFGEEGHLFCGGAIGVEGCGGGEEPGSDQITLQFSGDDARGSAGLSLAAVLALDSFLAQTAALMTSVSETLARTICPVCRDCLR